MQCLHSKMGKNIVHEGVVADIQDGVARIRINRQSACSACHVQSACTLTDTSQRTIDVACPDTPLRIGETVLLTGSCRLETQLILWAFLYPFVLSAATLLAVYRTTENELWAGLSALAALIPYYITLYFCKNKLKKIFEFSIRKTEP